MKQVIKFIPFVAAGFVIASCSNGTAHKVTLSSVHGEWHGATQAYEGVNYSATFTPENGYELKGSDLYVRVNSARLAENKDYTFYDNRLTVLSGAITGDVTITAKASAIEYSIINNLENATISTDKAFHNQTLNLTVKAREFYILPDEIKVYVNDQELKSGYTYTPNENLLTVNAECVTGTITLEGKSFEKIDVTFSSGEGAWHEPTYLTTKHAYIKKGSTFAEAVKQISEPTATEDLDFDDWYYNDKPLSRDTIVEENFAVIAAYRPLSLNINGTSQSYFQFDWNGMLHDHGTVPYGEAYNLTIDFLPHPVPKNNIVIPNEAHTVTLTEGNHCFAANLKDSYEESEEVSFQIIAEYGYDLPAADKIIVEGVTDYYYNVEASLKMATFTCKMLTNNINITVPATETTGHLYIMPEAIKITSTPRKGEATVLVPDTDYSITRTDDKIVLNIKEGVIRGDLMIEVNPYYVATVEFDPGEGTWVGGGTGTKKAEIKIGGPDMLKFNVLEALRIIAKETEPVPTQTGKAFYHWQNVETETTVDVNSIVSDNLKLKAVYGGIDFEHDSWANVITNANKGLGELLAAYGMSSPDNLVSCARDIVTGNDQIGYYSQKAIVIGYTHDTIANSTDKKATLTFAFQKVFAESVFDQDSLPQPHSPHNAWKGSYLQTNMVSTLGGFVPDIVNSLVEVKKQTFNSTTLDYDTTNDKFFAFSQNELNITSSSGSGVKIEGVPYAYFKDGGSLARESVLVEDNSYWLRSAYLTDTPSTTTTDVYYVDGEGNVKNDVYSKSHGVFVGFCLGQVQG